MRLHFLTNGEKGKEEELKDDLRPVMMPDGKDGYRLEEVDRLTLNQAYMDVGLAGEPMQVSLGRSNVTSDEQTCSASSCILHRRLIVPKYQTV